MPFKFLFQLKNIEGASYGIADGIFEMEKSLWKINNSFELVSKGIDKELVSNNTHSTSSVLPSVKIELLS